MEIRYFLQHCPILKGKGAAQSTQQQGAAAQLHREGHGKGKAPLAQLPKYLHRNELWKFRAHGDFPTSACSDIEDCELRVHPETKGDFQSVQSKA